MKLHMFILVLMLVSAFISTANAARPADHLEFNEFVAGTTRAFHAKCKPREKDGKCGGDYPYAKDHMSPHKKMVYNCCSSRT